MYVLISDSNYNFCIYMHMLKIYYKAASYRKLIIVVLMSFMVMYL